MPSMVVIVINESFDSAVERDPVFLWLDVNILVFYRFPKSFKPNIDFGPAAAVHADTHLRVLGTCLNPSLASELAALVRVYDLKSATRHNRVLKHFYTLKRCISYTNRLLLLYKYTSESIL